jgi:hypothetical protein
LINSNWFPEYIIEILADIGALNQILDLIRTNIPLKLLTEILQPYLIRRNQYKILKEFFGGVFNVSIGNEN